MNHTWYYWQYMNHTLIVFLALLTPVEKNAQNSRNSLPTRPHHLIYKNNQVQKKFRCPGRTSQESHILAHFLASSLIFKKQDKFIFIWINSTLGDWEYSCNDQNFCTNSQTSTSFFSSFMKPINSVCRNPTTGLNMKFHFLQWLYVHLQFKH